MTVPANPDINWVRNSVLNVLTANAYHHFLSRSRNLSDSTTTVSVVDPCNLKRVVQLASVFLNANPAEDGVEKVICKMLAH